jgi:hypothetical protein
MAADDDPPTDPRNDVVPDTKDWTWVLGEQCPECGFDATGVPGPEVADRARRNAAAWRLVLARPGARDRPAAGVWSPLEYACHVRDVHRIFGERLARMLAEDDPLFANWDQDETAVRDRYGEQDPATVADELAGAAGVLADRFDTVAGDAWTRTGRRTDGARFTVETFGQYYAHDWVHHLHDVGGDVRP